MRYSLFAALFACLSIVVSAETVIVSGTPMFEKPTIKSKVVGTVPRDITLSEEGAVRHFLDVNPNVTRYHPITAYLDFLPLDIEGRGRVWVSEDLMYDLATNDVQLRIIPQMQWAWVMIVFLGLLVLVAVLNRDDLKNLFNSEDMDASKKRLVVLIAIPILLRLVFLSMSLFFSGRLILLPADEYGYFQVGKDILGGSFDGPWKFTIGQGLYYIPFILLTGTEQFYGMAIMISLFTAAVVSTGCMALVFLIIRDLSGSERAAFWTILFLAVLPFLYFPVEFHGNSTDGIQPFKAICSFPDFSSVSYTLYATISWTGLNGMSDTPSVCLILLTVAACLWLPDQRWATVLIGVLFGLACLTRIANIFIAPLIAYCMWRRAHAYRHPLKETGIHAGIAVASFFVAFLPQFLVNMHQFDGPLTFGYSLHTNRSSEGFAINTLMGGIRFLVNCNYAFIVCGVAGLIFARSRSSRILLTLWVVPLLFLYFGYPVVGASPIRFVLIIFPALLAAFLMARPWMDMTPRSRIIAAVLMMCNVLFVAPCFRTMSPHPFRLETYAGGNGMAMGLIIGVPIITAICFWLISKGQRRVTAFLFTWLVLFHLGNPYVLAAALAGIMLWIAIMWVQELKALKTRSTPDTSPS